MENKLAASMPRYFPEEMAEAKTTWFRPAYGVQVLVFIYLLT
jgi:hypothetical protein